MDFTEEATTVLRLFNEALEDNGIDYSSVDESEETEDAFNGEVCYDCDIASFGLPEDDVAEIINELNITFDVDLDLFGYNDSDLTNLITDVING